jgi:hypothetical protein
MLGILSLQFEHANNAHMGDAEEKERISKMATEPRSHLRSGRYLARQP